MLLVAAPAHAALVAQIGRCIGPAERSVDDPLTKGFGNQASTRALQFSFAYSRSDPSLSYAAEIAATNRVEVCYAKPVTSGGGTVSAVSCPGWNSGGSAWIIFDRAASIGSEPPTAKIKSKPTDSADKGSQLFEQDLPVDWDDPTWTNAILFMVVNATSKPTTLSSATSAINASGFCGVENRIGMAGIGIAPTTSSPGATSPANITHVVYGVPDDFTPASDWTFGTVCSSSNKAGFDGWSPVCVSSTAALFGLTLLTGVDQWQYSVVDAGAGSLAVHTWWNGPGGGSTTCGGTICPTRAFWHPVSGGAGYGYGGSFSTPAGDYGTRLDVFDPTASGSLRSVLDRHNAILRGQAHEYFHGHGNTWIHYSGSNLFNDELVAEAVATSMEWAACLTNYPAIHSLVHSVQSDYTLPATRCISSRNLYGPMYTYGGLLSGNDYLLVPENPLRPYMGALFYRYIAEQFAYPPQTLSNMSTHSSVSPVLFDTSNKELPVGQRHPDEGMDLIGYFFASLDTGRSSSLPCNQSLASSAGVTDRLDCVLKEYLGRSYDDVLLEFHTMLVLKDYLNTDSRWRMNWLGDYNAGELATTIPGAWSSNVDSTGHVMSIGQLKPFVKNTATGGTGYPSQPTKTMPDQLYRVRRVLDTYLCTTPSNCSGSGLKVNTLAAGASLSGGPVAMVETGASFLSIHPGAGYGTLNVHAQVTSGSPRFRVFSIDNSGKPTLVSACAGSPYGSEVCPVGSNGTMDVSVAVTSSTDEVLLVASSGNHTGSFTWRFGPDQARLQILSPKAASPANIGSLSGTNLSRRAAVVNFTALRTGNQPYDSLTSANLVFRVGGKDLNGPSDCPGASCPFTLTNFTGGTYMAVLNIPASLYPTTTGTLDLQVAVRDGSLQSDTAQAALVVTSAAQKVATALVVDVSGSMGQNSKLDAAKQAAQLIIDGMADTDAAGLIVYSTHSLQVRGMTDLTSQTVRNNFATDLNSLTAGGSTSIGDALFRAQDALASAYDATPDPNRVQNILLITDGLSNCSWTPHDYLYSNQSQDAPLTTCTNCECNTDTVPTYPPWPADKSTAPYANAVLSYFDRQNKPLPTPVISTVGVGPDADMGSLSLITALTGGVQIAIPSVGTTSLLARMLLSSVERQNTQVAAGAPSTLSLTMADAFRHGMNAATGQQRLLASVSGTLASLPALPVEAGTTSLLVSVLSVGTGVDSLQLRAPNGQLTSPVRSATNRAVFSIASPQAGNWTWQGGNSTASDVFVEAAVRSTCQLFTKTDVIGHGTVLLPGSSGDVDDQRWVGSDVQLQATLNRGGGVVNGKVRAEVTSPTGDVQTIWLADDGQHHDGRPGDGVFGAIYTGTSSSGSYVVRYFAEPGSDPNGCRRERAEGFRLRDAPDVDGDGLPDWWQARYGLPSGSAWDDPDGDGLMNAQEFVVHTRPDLSDTDGSGENDGSELAAGRNPLDPTDDAIGTPTLVVRPGNNRVIAQLGMPVRSGTTVEIYGAASESGPFVLDLSTNTEPTPFASLPVNNGVRRCFRARAFTAQATSGWSQVACATPADDPNPPQITRLWIDQGDACTRGSLTQLHIEASDGVVEHQMVDPQASTSGIKDMLIDLSSNTTRATWQPFSPSVSLSLGNATSATVSVSVRDAAGNQSSITTLDVSRCYTPLPCYFGANSLTVGDRSTLKGTAATNRAFELGAGTIRGEVTALQSTFLHDQAKVDGKLLVPAMSTITYQNQQTISVGKIDLIPGADTWTIHTKSVTPGSQSITLEGGPATCKKTLSPGAYGNITVRGGCVLTLQSGQYSLGQLYFDANARLVILGPVQLDVDQLFRYGDNVQATGAGSPNDLRIYTNMRGVMDILPGSQLTAMISAPYADPWIKSNVNFSGCVAANSLRVEPDTAMTGWQW